MSVQEKLDRTTRESFEKRWALIDYWKWFYITKNEMPYKWSKEHFLLRVEENQSGIIINLQERSKNWYEVRLNPTDRQSVQRLHFHLIKR